MAVPTSPDDPGLRSWSRGQPIEADRLNALQNKVITDLHGGPGIRILRKNNQAVVSAIEQPSPPPAAADVSLQITSAVEPGVYNAKTFAAPSSFSSSSLTEAALGTIAAADDAFAWDLPSIALATALPLTGLITRGRVIGTDTASGKSIVVIPPPGIRKLRFNATTKFLQAAFIDNPAGDADWVNQVEFFPCP